MHATVVVWYILVWELQGRTWLQYKVQFIKANNFEKYKANTKFGQLETKQIYTRKN